MAESVTTTATKKVTACYHCGQACDAQRFSDGDRLFCCAGCLSVYHLLQGSHLDGYYRDDTTPGLRPASEISVRHAYLDDPAIQSRLLDYQDAERSRVHFRIPQMHCAACVWLLERLFQLREGILKSEVNFPERAVTIIFRHEQISLRQVVELLANLGYEPQITLDSLDRKITRNPNVRLYARIGIAGFAFANIMLFSLPEYFSGGLSEQSLSLTFRVASLLLATPVLLYSASDYFRSAYQGLRERFVNLDVPLSLGIGMLYFRSLFDIVTNAGPGYLDSFTGLVFFLLLGRLFQQKTYDRLSFERDYRSYFPISAIKVVGSGQTTVPITELKPGDHIMVRNQELVPADGVLLNGPARLDYSFVTGEAALQSVEPLQKVFAGGRQIGGAIELEVIRSVSQSYLVGLWGSQNLPKDKNRTTATLANSVGLWFTGAVLVIAASASIYWGIVDPARIMFAVTSVLIVACPCALALSSPFVLGTASRLWGKHGLFVRTPMVVEAVSTINSIVFDKTGTLTHSSDREGRFARDTMNDRERSLVYSLVSQSTHPVSRAIARALAGSGAVLVSDYREFPGEGISAMVDGHEVQVGRAGWLAKGREEVTRSDRGTSTGHATHILIDGICLAEYIAASQFRDGIKEAADELKQNYAISVMSGDTSREETAVRMLLGEKVTARFGCSPHDKLDGIAAMTASGNRVLMVGVGLNDAGALQAATVGVAVTEDSSAFTPACDAILEANSIRLIPRFVAMARRCRVLIWWSFALSFLYNAIGLSFAVTGYLSPVVSAILMPTSSVSVVLFAVLSTRWAARREGLS